MVELLVAMAIGLITVLIITQVFSTAEATKRTVTGSSDAQQTGTFSAYALERQVRLGGTGFSRLANVWGCPLQVWRSNVAAVPLPSNLSPVSTPYVNHIRAPINTALAGQVLRLTPVLIFNGGGNTDADATSPTPDTIVVMGGQHESATMPYLTTSVATTTSVGLVNTVGINQNDLLVAVDQNPGSGVSNCRVVQATDAVSPATAVGVVPNPVSFSGGTYTPNVGGVQALNGYSATAQLGDIGAAPTFVVYALGSDGTTSDSLLTYDMIQGTLGSLADNIVNLQAVYGVAATRTSNDITSWQAPTGTWSAATLMNGTAASADNIARIRAVRIAIVARSANFEKAADWTAPTLALFNDLSAATPAADIDMTFSGSAQRFRYRTYEVSVPLRNMLLMNNS